MAEERVQRRLAAILAADVVGYSRLMEDDEEGTLARLKALRTDIIDPKLAEYGGRVFKTTGDGILAEFPSAVDTVRHAVDVQRAMAEINANLPETNRIAWRIGISLGDVMVDGDDLLGNGVNVAARMEGLADAGGICVSGNIQEHVANSLDVVLEDLGEQTVKNIRQPVRCFRVRLDPDRTLEKPLPLPDKPSIAVLPFENMSADPEQEYFSDGITEDIITELSKVSGLFVIARHSAFTYKTKSVTLKEVGRELGVRYVMEGSVRKAGNRLRITAQLIDAMSDLHVWAERYDRDLTDIFAVQDEITEKIVAALAVKLTAREQNRAENRYTENLDAYDCFLRGRAYHARNTKDTNSQARQLFERAIELDPNFAAAYAMLAHTFWRDWRHQWHTGSQNLERAYEEAKRAISLDASLPLAHTYLAWIYLFRHQHENAIAEGERAISLDPNFAEGYARLGAILSYAGRPEESVGMIEKAMRLNPHYPASYLPYLGETYYSMGKYEEAITHFRAGLGRNPDQRSGALVLAAIYSELGRMDDALAQISEVLRISPQTSLEDLADKWPWRDRNILRRFMDALRKIDLPA